MDLARTPPATHDYRPERKDIVPGPFDGALQLLLGSVVRPWRGRLAPLRSMAARVRSHEQAVQAMTAAELTAAATRLRLVLIRHGFRAPAVAEAFALVREAAGRTLGKRHFDSQLIGGWVMLKGMIAEMETGEGKTLTAALAAATAALAGMPVHVISVNDYLTARDAKEMGPIYRALGLTVGCITHELPPAARRAAYACDIVYCTNKEITFDYLRDTMALSTRQEPVRLQAESLYRGSERVRRVLLRGLHFAIVDEADSILIDEARTPLILSGAGGGKEERQFLDQALTLAQGLERGTDYRLDAGNRQVLLTTTGREQIRLATADAGPLWAGRVRREQIVRQALVALNLFHRDEHYLVREGKVEIVDEFTGRVMADRSWEQGLHQLIEIKEGCELTSRRDTLARISYQMFFRRYLRLAGMTGTAREVRAELWSTYGLPVVRVPTNRPVIRRLLPDTICRGEAEKWQTVVERLRALHHEGRPVLVGTRSVAASEHLSRLVTAAGLAHQVLNAKQDEDEAGIVARAGEAGRITIATNMAGRGTDIKPEEAVLARQGLHVILTERHEAARIDRQLAGRCGRQGNSGSVEAILSLADPLLDGGRAGVLGWAARRLLRDGTWLWYQVARWSIIRAQKKVERSHGRLRRDLFKQDRQRGSLLAFSGRSE